MKVLTLLIPGAFEDAFVYMGRIVALTRDRSLRFYRFDTLVESVVTPATSPFLTHLFLRNDWLAGDGFPTLLAISGLREALTQEIDRLPTVVEPPSEKRDRAIEAERDLGLRDHLLLDCQIYNQRLYLSAGTGFYHIDPDWDSLNAWRGNGPTRRHDRRSISSTAGYGAVNVSCGDDGLFTCFDEFHWTGHPSTGTFDRTAARSLRTVWSGSDLINYSSSTTPELLRATSEPTAERGVERERRVVTALGVDRIDLTETLRNEVMAAEGAGGDAQFVFNSTSNVFVYTESGHLLVVGLRKDGRREEMVKSARSYEALRTAVLGMHSARLGIVVETEDSVLLFNEGKWFKLYERAALTVRTFPRSKRYRNLVLVTSEDGIAVISPSELGSDT